MGNLLACPFCRSLYSRGEGDICPQCDLRLVELSRLPPSDEALADAGLLDAPSPLDQPLPLTFWRRGRGPVFLLSATGLWLFFQPWARLERPDQVLLSGFDIARGGALWLFGGAVGWFLLLPLLLTRRSLRALIGSRAIVVTAALMTVLEAILLLLRPPEEGPLLHWNLTYEWGLSASLAVGLLTAALGLILGGSDKDFRDLPLGTAHRPAPRDLLH